MSEARLLVIDDDPDFVEGLVGILEPAGYEVDARYNPRDGFEALKSGDYDLLVLDIIMGRGAEGVMLARKVRNDERVKDIPMMVITGIRDQMDFLVPGRPLDPRFMPVDELLEKPVKPDVLLDKVSTLVQTGRRTAAQGD